jgi:hypothetical protein
MPGLAIFTMRRHFAPIHCFTGAMKLSTLVAVPKIKKLQRRSWSK